MDLKLQESWVSSTLLNYGKEIIIDGSYTSSGIKKISRAYQEVSEIYPSLQSRAAAIYTSAQSTGMKSFESIVPYIIANLDCLNMITKKSSSVGSTLEKKGVSYLASKHLQLDEHLKLVFLLLPRECGGLPTISYLTLQFRGHPDSVTHNLYWLKLLSPKIPVAKRILDNHLWALQ